MPLAERRRELYTKVPSRSPSGGRRRPPRRDKAVLIIGKQPRGATHNRKRESESRSHA